MPTAFRYGENCKCLLAVEGCTLLSADSERHPEIEDVASALREALGCPLGYPPLAAATVPGDHVVVAVEDGVPQLANVVRGALAALTDAGVAPENTTVVWGSTIIGHKKVEVEMGEGPVRFELHDPDDERAMAMVGVTSEREPLRLNRTIAEADFVLPIGVSQRMARAGQAPAKFAGLFPAFSNQETQRRFQAENDKTPKQRAKRRKEVDEAGWLLGVGMTAAVVPGAHGSIVGVFVGDPAMVSAAADDRLREIWEREAEDAGDLVIAAVSGEKCEQTWDNLALAVRAAARVLRPGGAIAVCSDLETLPPEPLNRLRDAVDFEEVDRELSHESGVGVEAARAFAQALDQGPVYLRSALPDELVESLGMTPFVRDEELSRLAAGREHCIIIEEAQRVIPTLAKESASLQRRG